jgi:hypothetical protein
VGHSYPRMHFCPGPEMRTKVDDFRRELSKRSGQTISNSQVVKAILEEFFEKKEKRGS